MKQPKDFTILIVDDEVDLKDLLAFNFENAGFKVLTASGGNEAFRLVQKNKIDLVVSDIQMPDGNGIEMLDKIKYEFPAMPVVMFVTGFSGAVEEDLIKKGAVAIFSKPFKKDDLIASVKKAVGIT